MRALLFALILSTVTAYAQRSVGFEWDQNAEPEVTRYRLYWGPSSRTYTNSIATSNITARISNVVVGATYYVAVTALTDQNLESDFSEELAFVVPSAPRRPRLNVSIQSSAMLDGNWTQTATLATFELPEGGRFFRSVVAFEP